jgi:phosphoglucosamine mutase
VPSARRPTPLRRRGRHAPLPEELLSAVEDVNAELGGTGRVLVRPSGTEPLVRVLAEAETPEIAEQLCARIAALVTHELG